jgi:hypothetical protein
MCLRCACKNSIVNPRKALARQIYDVKPVDMSMGPPGSMWLEANRQHTVSTSAQAQWQKIVKDYDESNNRPSGQTVNDVVNATRAARNPVLLDTIAHDTERMDLAGQAARSPLALQQSNITNLNAAGNVGALTPGHYQLIADLQRKYNGNTTRSARAWTTFSTVGRYQSMGH